jgi:hypothetical protein
MTYVTIPLKQFENFQNRSIGSKFGMARIHTIVDLDKKYKILNKSYRYAVTEKVTTITLTFETEQDASWFILNV